MWTLNRRLHRKTGFNLIFLPVIFTPLSLGTNWSRCHAPYPFLYIFNKFSLFFLHFRDISCTYTEGFPSFDWLTPTYHIPLQCQRSKGHSSMDSLNGLLHGVSSKSEGQSFSAHVNILNTNTQKTVNFRIKTMIRWTTSRLLNTGYLFVAGVFTGKNISD